MHLIIFTSYYSKIFLRYQIKYIILAYNRVVNRLIIILLECKPLGFTIIIDSLKFYYLKINSHFLII